jgi:hypothetical protein
MIEMAIDTLIMLGVAGIAIFIILITINIVLFLKLRSDIPQKHASYSEHVTERA